MGWETLQLLLVFDENASLRTHCAMKTIEEIVTREFSNALNHTDWLHVTGFLKFIDQSKRIPSTLLHKATDIETWCEENIQNVAEKKHLKQLYLEFSGNFDETQFYDENVTVFSI